jgi:hypothetical protein
VPPFSSSPGLPPSLKLRRALEPVAPPKPWRRRDRAIQHCRDSNAGADRPRRTGSPAFAGDDDRAHGSHLFKMRFSWRSARRSHFSMCRGILYGRLGGAARSVSRNLASAAGGQDHTPSKFLENQKRPAAGKPARRAVCAWRSCLHRRSSAQRLTARAHRTWIGTLTESTRPAGKKTSSAT